MKRRTDLTGRSAGFSTGFAFKEICFQSFYFRRIICVADVVKLVFRAVKSRQLNATKGAS